MAEPIECKKPRKKPKPPERHRLTQRYVEQQKPPEQERFVWDTKIPRFGLRVRPSGQHVYVIQYRFPPGRKGKTRRLGVGKASLMAANEARAEAIRLLLRVDAGDDPARERDERKLVGGETLTQFADRYLDFARTRKRPRSIYEDERLLQRNILPTLGERRVRDLSRGDLVALHQSLARTPILGNRVIALLSRMMTLAQRWGFRDAENPARYVERYKEVPRQTFLTPVELGRLAAALEEAERTAAVPKVAVWAIKALLLTGCRCSEILTLRWEDVDFEGACFHIREGKRGPRRVLLSVSALELFRSFGPKPNGWVFPSPTNPHKRYVSLTVAWSGSDWKKKNKKLPDGTPNIVHTKGIRELSDLCHTRLHDLRHAYGSLAAGMGLSLYVLGKLLGHSRPETTQRYAELQDDPLRAAAEAVGAEIARQMDEGRQKVFDLGRARKGR